MTRLAFTLVLLCLLPSLAHAGLYYSGETVAELPSRWRGFLIDHRALRGVAIEKPGNLPPSPLRGEDLAALKQLERATAGRAPTADEAADLGALYVRLGKPEKAIEVLRPTARRFPEHFRVAANLGTAWQLAGDLGQAAAALEEAVRLAPVSLKAAEKLHLKLVSLRHAERRIGRAADAPDDLFGVRYVGESGKPEAGRLAAAERKKLPPGAVALVQRLAMWLPADGRLLWQLGELANADGDVVTASAILDGCVTEFGMGSPDLRKRRQLYRTAADVLTKKPGHGPHRGMLVFNSPRPLVKRLDEATLPPISVDGPTPLGWPVLAATTPNPDARPTFPKYLAKLDGKRVTMLGYMQVVGEEPRPAGFLLLEYPVGCWFCEMPEPTGLVSVELKPGTRTEPRRGLIKVTGTLKVNASDPEDFLFRISDATIGEPE